jgi:integrase/recombinase XerD
MRTNWRIKAQDTGMEIALARYEQYLKQRGLRKSTIIDYVGRVKRYLKAVGTDWPGDNQIEAYRQQLLGRNLSRSTLNNYHFAIAHYHGMNGEEVKLFPLMRRDSKLPYYFDEEDVLRIFGVVQNLKHLAILQTLFYGCLRATELCNLDDQDINLKDLTLHIREGKGGRDGYVYLSEDAARTLKQYLAIRPPLVIDGHQPLFYTDAGNRWERCYLHQMFTDYKRKAGITKKGGLHVFARHTTATLMIKKGCSVAIVQKLLRHKSIQTTAKALTQNKMINL